MWALSLTIVLLFPLLSAAPIELGGGVMDDDGMHSHDENVTRAAKFFGHNQFDVGNINVSGSVEGDDVSIGHQVNIDVQGHTHDRYHHEDDTVIECKEGLREMFKSIDSNKDGLMDAKELLRVCHQNNIQITESLAVRILTLPDKTVGFNMAKFCELLKDCPSNNSAGFIYFLLQLFHKASCSGTESDWACCSSTSPCKENEGDCDTDDDCVGSLVCGKDNCRSINPLAYHLADCCIQPVEKREFSPPRPQSKVICPYKDDLSSVLLENHWKTQDEIDVMSEEDKRNTVIVEVGKITDHTDLQGRANAGEFGSLTAIANMASLLIKYSIRSSTDVKTMTYDDLRNTLIIETGKRFRIPALQHFNDIQLLKRFCRVSTGVLRLYEFTGEAGRSLTIYEPTNNLQLRNFDNLVSSVHAVKGGWELYTGPDYIGQRMEVKEGQRTGVLEEDNYSSARPICQYYDDRSIAKLDVYSKTKSQGTMVEYLHGEDNIEKENHRSFHVVKGDWEVYSSKNYEGYRFVAKEGEQYDFPFPLIPHWSIGSTTFSLRPICDTYTHSPKCTLESIEILVDPNSLLKFKGTKIIGTASGFSCNDPSTQTLTLNSVNSVTKSISLSKSDSLGTNWALSGSASIKAKVGFLGSGTEVTASITGSTGGSVTVTHQTTETVTTGNSKLVGSSTTYQTPGAAIAFGTVDMYETDNSDVPVKISSVCDGKMKEERSTMKLTRQTFQSADFVHFAKQIDNAEDCNQDGFITNVSKCIRNVKNRYINGFGQQEKMRKDFNDCFS